MNKILRITPEQIEKTRSFFSYQNYDGGEQGRNPNWPFPISKPTQRYGHMGQVRLFVPENAHDYSHLDKRLHELPQWLSLWSLIRVPGSGTQGNPEMFELLVVVDTSQEHLRDYLVHAVHKQLKIEPVFVDYDPNVDTDITHFTHDDLLKLEEAMGRSYNVMFTPQFSARRRA